MDGQVIDYYLMNQKGSALDLSEYIIRVVTDEYRYRLSFEPKQTYADLLQVLSIKTGIPPAQLQVYSQNGRKLNVRPERMLKQVVYLRHGSVLKVELPKKDKRATSPQSNIYIRNYNQPQSSPHKKSPCNHPENMRCLSCFSPTSSNNFYTGNGLAVTTTQKALDKNQANIRCDHGSNMKCLKCLNEKGGEQQKKEVKKSEERLSILSTPRKLSPPGKPECSHSPSLKCNQCMNTLKKSLSSAMLKTQSSISSPKNMRSPPNSPEKSPEKSPQKPTNQHFKPKCLHGQLGKCINCINHEKMENSQQQQKKRLCNHSEHSKCIHCVNTNETKTAHIAFDDYLKSRSKNCANNHSKDNECPNCQPLKNPRLQLNKNCDRHAAYPKGMCNRCLPENVSLKRQEYRHVDYVQFMNNSQVHNFINYWVEEKKMSQMRIGFLYGYYAEDPFYKNGIRAIVQALYEPEQKCTANRFQLKDSPQRIENLQLIIDSLGLEKIGVVIASPFQDLYLTEQQVRTIADFQEEASVIHSSGYKLSNFFTVLIRPNNQEKRIIEPQVFMISDQGQAMQAASLFEPNPANPKKMKVKISQQQILPIVYEGGRPVSEFDIEFLLVKIASGISKSNKFAILKNNEFPTFNRGRVKKTVLKDYLKANVRKRPLVKYGDLNLLMLIAQLISTDKAMELALRVSNQQDIQQSLNQLVDKKLEALL